jgi:hypothetical protein
VGIIYKSISFIRCEVLGPPHTGSAKLSSISEVSLQKTELAKTDIHRFLGLISIGEHPEGAHSPPPSIGEAGQPGTAGKKKKKTKALSRTMTKDYKENPDSTARQREEPKPTG